MRASRMIQVYEWNGMEIGAKQYYDIMSTGDIRSRM